MQHPARMAAWQPMAEQDLPAVAAISDAVHGRYTEDEAVFAERLALFPAGCRVLRKDGAVAGYLIAHPWHCDAPPALNAFLGGIPHDANGFYLHDLALLPAARGEDAGRSALDHVEALAREGGFADITLMAVNGADAYWRRMGFVAVENPPRTYGAEAVFMRLKLA